jgi:hypothetical protein
MGQPRYNATKNQFEYGFDTDTDTAYTANGAIAIASGVVAIAKTSAAAMTLAAPAAADEGIRMVILARTAFAHTVTFAGGLGGNAADDVVTFAKVGDSIEVVADNLKWCPVSAPYGAVIS